LPQSVDLLPQLHSTLGNDLRDCPLRLGFSLALALPGFGGGKFRSQPVAFCANVLIFCDQPHRLVMQRLGL
jgi:hypothetical protein